MLNKDLSLYSAWSIQETHSSSQSDAPESSYKMSPSMDLEVLEQQLSSHFICIMSSTPQTCNSW
jgi:hypothetical protein